MALIVRPKTDLLGAFTQKILFARFLANFTGKKLILDPQANLDDMSGFEKQPIHVGKYKNVSTDSKTDHLRARHAMVRCLIDDDVSPQISNVGWLGTIHSIQHQICSLGIDRVINDQTRIHIRRKMLDILPPFPIPTTNLIAVHFRCGEIITMPERFIPSSRYQALLKYLEEQYPKHKIIILAGKLPPKSQDDLRVFQKFEIWENKPSTLAIWRLFLEAPVFVMAKSSFSYTPALLRLNSQTTFYKDFWHPKLKNWRSWH